MTMTKKELIETLRNYPDDAAVYINDHIPLINSEYTIAYNVSLNRVCLFLSDLTTRP